MQVTAGWAKGLKISTPTGKATRPTSAKVREAVFSMVHHYFGGGEAAFLDLFSGSGSMGIEAMSRGACSCVFVEKASGAIKCLQKNVNEAKRRAATQSIELDRIQVISKDVKSALPMFSAGTFDIIWADPPYEDVEMWIDNFATKLSEVSSSDAIFIMEAGLDSQESLNGFTDKSDGDWLLKKQKQYGDTLITMWERQQGDENE